MKILNKLKPEINCNNDDVLLSSIYLHTIKIGPTNKHANIGLDVLQTINIVTTTKYCSLSDQFQLPVVPILESIFESLDFSAISSNDQSHDTKTNNI